MSSQPLLKVANLNVNLGKEEIIKNLSFEIQAGEILTILGPNGAGKTVLLKALLGLLPYQGEARWSQKIKIGYLPQGLTPLKIKDLPLSVEEFFKLKISIRLIQKSLNQLGILEKNFLKKRMGDLSFGQFQRVLIAWTLIDEPDVLFFDEPTTGIDISGMETVYSLLHQIWQKKKITILLVTHDLNIIYQYSSRVLCLNQTAVCFGQPKEVLNPEVFKKMYGSEVKFYQHAH